MYYLISDNQVLNDGIPTLKDAKELAAERVTTMAENEVLIVKAVVAVKLKNSPIVKFERIKHK